MKHMRTLWLRSVCLPALQMGAGWLAPVASTTVTMI